MLVVATLLGVLTLPCTVTGQVQVPWLGIWKLNVAKSTYDPGPPPFKRATCTIESSGRGLADGVNVTYDMVRQRGGITHLEWTGRFDGKDYPLQGVEGYAVTAAYRRIDDRTLEVVQKVDGAPAVTARMTISPDGQTLTMVGSGSTVVYDRGR